MAVHTGISAGNSPPRAGKGVGPATVLVLEDEGLMHWTMKERLSREGLRVLEAETGAEALDICRSQHVDLALLDLQLPDMDGLSVLTRLRAEASSFPAIVMTAYGTPETAERAASAGVRGFVAKPFDLEEMVSLIETELARS